MKQSFITISVNILTIIVVLFAQKILPPEIPLFYGKPLTNEQLGAKIYLLIPPSLALALSIINVLIIKKTEDELILRLLTILNVAITLISTITVIKIILLVGNI